MTHAHAGRQPTNLPVTMRVHYESEKAAHAGRQHTIARVIMRARWENANVDRRRTRASVLQRARLTN